MQEGYEAELDVDLKEGKIHVGGIPKVIFLCLCVVALIFFHIYGMDSNHVCVTFLSVVFFGGIIFYVQQKNKNMN